MLLKYIASILCCLIIGSGILIAQKEIPPEGGQPKDFKLPEKETYTLENGLKVTLVQYGTIPKVNASFKIRVGNINETENEVWLADLVADYLKEGTSTRTAREIAEAAASIGGEINTSTAMDFTTIAGEALAEFAPELITLMSDILLHPQFPESELARLKNNYLRQLSVQKAKPQSLVQERFLKTLYPNHAYGRSLSTEAIIENFNISKVVNFYRTHFCAAKTNLYIVGMFDVKQVKEAIRKNLNQWLQGETFVENLPKPFSERAVHLVDQPGAAQSTIMLGLPVIHPANPDYVPLLVTNALLGGVFMSRITTNIREDKGYTYTPFSLVSSRYRDAYWAQQASVGTEVTGPALKEIFYEIDRLHNEPPPSPELMAIQNYLAGIFVLQNSSRNGIINQLSFVDLHGLDENYLTSYVRRVHAVTPVEVQRIMKTYLKSEKMTIVIVGDLGQIEGEVKAYGKIIM